MNTKPTTTATVKTRALFAFTDEVLAIVQDAEQMTDSDLQGVIAALYLKYVA
jgi:hypothetical protein